MKTFEFLTPFQRFHSQEIFTTFLGFLSVFAFYNTLFPLLRIQQQNGFFTFRIPFILFNIQTLNESE